MINVNLSQLYNIASDNNIEVDNFDTKAVDSFSMPHIIVLNKKGLKRTLDKKMHMAHELGHCLTWSFYHSTSKYDTRSRMECRADRWVIHNLIPFFEFYAALQSGLSENWQLAEYFEVTEDYIIKAKTMYEQKIYDLQKGMERSEKD